MASSERDAAATERFADAAAIVVSQIRQCTMMLGVHRRALANRDPHDERGRQRAIADGREQIRRARHFVGVLDGIQVTSREMGDAAQAFLDDVEKDSRRCAPAGAETEWDPN